jgi:serine/threonine protein kinase
MLNELGRGAFSIVKLAKEKSTGKSVAVKIIEKKNVAPEYKKNLETETQILRKVAHPNIIQLLEMFETDEFLFLVMELVVGGELFDRIVEKVGRRKTLGFCCFKVLHRARTRNWKRQS